MFASLASHLSLAATTTPMLCDPLARYPSFRFTLNRQLLECLASVSTVLSAPGAGGGSTGSGNGGSAHPSLPDEYWFLVKGRTVSSVMGIVVGTLGIRGSQSLSTRTIRLYFVGLVMCAIVAMAIRIEVFYDIVTGKVGGSRVCCCC